MLRKLSRTALVFGAAVGISLAAGSPAMADSQGTSVGINFAAEEPDGGRSDVNGAAGLFDTVNWNNLEGASGGPAELFADTLGSRDLEGGGITVTWESNNTWSSTGRGNEENNDAPPGDDRNLMTGYLDTTATSVTRVTVSGLQAAFDGPYDVYVYMKGGVNDRGGDYTIGGETLSHVDTAPFSGNYRLGPTGDVIIFRDVMGDSFTVEATPTTEALFRAPLNAIEIVESREIRRVPFLSGWGLFAVIPLLVGIGAVAIRRRKLAMVPGR